MDKLSRRNFIALSATGALGAGVLASRGLRADAPGEAVSFVVDPTIKNPTDKVRLGKTDLQISIVGIGTGTNGWNRQSNQTRLGQESFTRLIRHAHDSGITFFDLADQYGSNPYFSRAMQGVARDRYVI